MRPCGHATPDPACRVCWLATHDPAYRALYGEPARGASPCVHLGAATGETVSCPSCRGHVELKLFACAVHGTATLGRRVMGHACCAGCPDRREEAEEVPRVELSPRLPAVAHPPRAWAYGVTTIAARRHELLPATLASLARAGFDAPRLFVDGDADVRDWEQEFGLPVTARTPPPLRVHGNWVLSLHELFIRHSAAERFALFQDDLLCVRNLRAYLDQCDYPDGPFAGKRQPGYLNLYAAPSEQKRGLPRGFHPSNQNGRGALALVFSREALLTLLTARHLIERPCDPVRGWRAVDGGIVDGMRKAGWCEYVHTPSLVRHVGKVSTFDKRKNSDGLDPDYPPHTWPDYYDRTDFPGEAYNALDLLR